MLPSSIGDISHYVNDFSDILSKEEHSQLDDLFQKIETESGKQVVVVIFPHREGKELIDIGTELFNRVGIGDKKLNNGLLLLISSDEKKLRIIVGKGLEFLYTNAWCIEIIESKLRPLLKQEKYGELIQIWANEIIKKESKIQHFKNTQDFRLDTGNPKKYFILDYILLIITFFSLAILGQIGVSLIPLYGIFIYLIVIIFFIFLLYKKYITNDFIKGYIKIIIICSLVSAIPILTIGFFNEREKIYCNQNPVICEQKKLAKEEKFCRSRPASCINGRIDYNSTDYKRYQSERIRSQSTNNSSSSRSSSSFGGGGGSTNSAGGGD